MQLSNIDLGGTNALIRYDQKGRVGATSQVLPKSISPKDAGQLRYNYDKLGADIDMANQKNAWQYYNTDTVAATSRQNSQRQAQAQLDAAKIRGEYGLEEAKMRGERTGSSGGRSGAQQGGGLKPNEALNILKQAQIWDEDHPGEEWANPLADARDKALVSLNDYQRVDPDMADSVYSFGQSVLEENARQGHPYTKEQLRQIISSIGGYGPQVADDLLSGQGAEYGR